VLTETLEVFFTALALDFAVVALNRMHRGQAHAFRLWAATGGAIGACILLRPDGGILLAVVVVYLVAAAAKATSGSSDGAASLKRRSFAAGIILVVVALALGPWTIRNFHTFHQFQPLAPRYANEMDELVTRGFNRWVKTWIVDYVSVEEIYWNVSGDKIDGQKLPSRAFDNLEERDTTLALIADYNESQDMTAELDARFGELAADRVRAHPLRYYVVLPGLRIADMWLRPRTELLPPDPRWWEFHDAKKESALAVGFGVLNLAYVGAALWALVRGSSGIRWVGLLFGFLLLRSAFLGTLENPEPRYTLEGYPVVIILAAGYLSDLSFLSSCLLNATKRKSESSI